MWLQIRLIVISLPTVWRPKQFSFSAYATTKEEKCRWQSSDQYSGCNSCHFSYHLACSRSFQLYNPAEGQPGNNNSGSRLARSLGLCPAKSLCSMVLDRVNKDRTDMGLLPVKLSSNEAAQMQAEDVFRTKQISHWTTNGEKPYMTYTQYDGEGSVQQNVAIAGFSPEQYEQCVTNILVECEKIEPLSTIERATE